MCRVLERGEPWSWGRWQHQSPVSPSVPNPPLASFSLAPNSSHLICGESCVKSLRNRLVQTYLGCVVVNYMSQPMQGMQQLRVGRWRGEAWWKLLSPESAWQGMGQLSTKRTQTSENRWDERGWDSVLLTAPYQHDNLTLTDIVLLPPPGRSEHYQVPL